MNLMKRVCVCFSESLHDDACVCVCVFCLLRLSYVEDKVNVNAYAGILFEDDDKKNKVAGRRKSAALLASRLLMAGGGLRLTLV